MGEIPHFLPQTLTSLGIATSIVKHPFQTSIAPPFQTTSFPLLSTPSSLLSSSHAKFPHFHLLVSGWHSSHGERGLVEIGRNRWNQLPQPCSVRRHHFGGNLQVWIDSTPFCAKSPATRPKRRSEGGVRGVKNRRFLRHQEG